MAESSSSHNNPDPRGQRKFRYGDSPRKDDEDYPLSRREEEMSPEEVEAYLAKQIELEQQQTSGRSPKADPSAPGGKKFITRPAAHANSSAAASSEDDEDEVYSKSGSGRSSRPVRRRPDQDFPELRTLRHWSLVSRWWMRSLGEGFYRFITLDWNLEEGAQALANWRPTQHTLWRFSTLTGVASILLTLLLFWQYRVRPQPAPEVNALVSNEPDFTSEDVIDPVPPQLTLVKDSVPDFSDFEKDEPKQLAMADDVSSFDFSNEPTIEPKPPVVEKPKSEDQPRIFEDDPMETEFTKPLPVRNDDEFDPPVAPKAKATASTIVKSNEPPATSDRDFKDDEWNLDRKPKQDSQPVTQQYKSVPLDFDPEPVKPDPKPEVTRVQEEKPIERPVPPAAPDLPPKQPVAEYEPPPVREPVAPPAPPRQRVAISRSGSWANDQQGTAIYSMTIRNLDSQELAELEIIESLPQGSKFVSASPGGQYDRTSHSVRWLISSLAGNNSSDLSVRVQPQVPQSTKPDQPKPAQTSRVQVSDRRGVVENRSWNVDHIPCQPGVGSYPRTAEVIPAGYYQEYVGPDYFFGW